MRRLNSPGGSHQLNHTGSPALSQHSATGEGRTGTCGQPPHHLRARWQLKMSPCRFLPGQHPQWSFLLPFARGAPQNQQLGFLPQCASPAVEPVWVSGSSPRKGKAQNRPVHPYGKVWAGGRQAAPWWEPLPGSALLWLPAVRWGVRPSPPPVARSLGSSEARQGPSPH